MYCVCVDYFINDLMVCRVLCFELSGLLDGQFVKPGTLRINVSLVGMTSRCVGP